MRKMLPASWLCVFPQKHCAVERAEVDDDNEQHHYGNVREKPYQPLLPKVVLIILLSVVLHSILYISQLLLTTTCLSNPYRLCFRFFSLPQVQLESDKIRRERTDTTTHLFDSRPELASLSGTRNAFRGGRSTMIDAHGNALPPLSPPSSNNNSTTELESDKPTLPMTPASKCQLVNPKRWWNWINVRRPVHRDGVTVYGH